MARTVEQYFDTLRETRIWRSIFRSGTGSSTLKRALAIQQNVFLHLFSTKVRTRMLSFSATWYLGTLTLGTFLILVATGIPLMLYYHPSAPQAYADTKLHDTLLAFAVARRWPKTPETYVVLVTRGHRNDAVVLREVIGSPYTRL